MAIDDIIEAGRKMARVTGQVLDNSKTATKALNKMVGEYGTALNNAKKIVNSNTATKALNEIVNEHGTALKNAKKIVNSNTTTKSINNIVQNHGTALSNAEKIANSNTTTKALDKIVNEYDTALNNAKKIANSNTSAPSRYDARGNYQQALEKAKEIANGKTTTKAINNNTPKTSTFVNNEASPFINNTPVDRPTPNTGYGPRVGVEPEKPKYGPRVDSSGSGNKPPNGPKTTVDAPEPPPLENNFDLSNFSDEEIEAAKRKASEAFKEDKLREAREKDFRNFGNKYFGGIADTYKGTKAGDGFWNSLEAAHKNADGSLRWDRIAGTYAAAAIGSRVISGGGLYKDKYGNTNLPGIPFI